MEATSQVKFNKSDLTKVDPLKEDKLALGHMKYAQGVGASLRYASELRAVQQVKRLPFLKSSNLHEDVLRGNLGAGNGFRDVFGDQEETRSDRVAFL